MTVKHIVTNRIDDVRRMADSKYVQSDMGSCFTRIKELLVSGFSILFCGTSCQVAGLKCFLSTTNTNTSNLLCVDFFCHGVPSPLIWKEYVDYYERKKRITPVSYRFRCNDFGWGSSARGKSYLNTMICKNGGKTKQKRDIIARSWRQILFSNLTLRRCCYSCNYCTVNKPSDITIGDFWKIENVLPEFDDTKGTSLVIVHNPEKTEFVTNIKGIKFAETDIEKSIQGQLNAYQPSAFNNKRDIFWNEYKSNGFDFVMRKYFVPYKRYIKEPIKEILFLLKMRNY